MLWREKEREGETTSPPFSLLSLQVQMFMVCINYWGLENVPHSGVAVQKPRLITFPFPRSLCLNSLAVNPSRHTSSSDSWETELLLFSNTTQSWPHRTISTAFFKKKKKKKNPKPSRVIFFYFILRVCQDSCSDPHATTAAISLYCCFHAFLARRYWPSPSLPSLLVPVWGGFRCWAPLDAHVVSNRPAWVR